MTLTSYPGTVRQLIVTGLGRDRQASLPAATTVPWWHGRRLHFEFS